MSAEVDGPSDNDQNYSFKSAAPFFSDDTTERQVRRWVDEGRIPYIQLPGGRKLRGSDINQFLADARVEQ